MGHTARRMLVQWVLFPLWRLGDWLLPKRPDCWAFFGHPLKRAQFVENSRALFEHVKGDPRIRKWVFVEGGAAALQLEGAVNTRVFELQSLAGLIALARCGVFLLTNSVSLDLSWRWQGSRFAVPRPALRRRVVVNLWHGIALKKLFTVANPEQRLHSERVRYRRSERQHYAGLIASSDIDSYAMAAMFHPLSHARIWLTGLPRNDFLRMPEVQLPTYLAQQLTSLRALAAGKRLLVYAPTFRDSQVGGGQCYRFSAAEIDQLKALLRRHQACLGFRMHYFRKGDQLFNMEDYVDGETILDLGHERFPEIGPVIRACDGLVTDYSSVYIDALYIDKPVFSFAYDLDHYREQQNGLLYDMELAFPGPVVGDFDALLAALDRELTTPIQLASPAYRTARKLFFSFNDASNSARVVERIDALVQLQR